MTNEIARLDAIGQAELVRSGKVSPTELVDGAIARIEELNPKINAVIHEMFDKAREDAASPDLPDGPFKGVPMLMKDLWPATKGDPMHLGNQAMKAANYISTFDSNMAVAYRNAGFVIAGRTNTPELGLVATTEPTAHGPSRNPWNLDHGAGGSSGGAAAAVASGMIPAANASDGGGSIRIPAAMCGLVGMKPSRGRVSMGPSHDEWGVSVQHVVTHSVRDSAAILDATAGPGVGDGVIAPTPGVPWLDQVGAPVAPLRIGVLDHSLTTDTDPECIAAAQEVARKLEAMGHHVENVYPDALNRSGEFTDDFMAIWMSGAANSILLMGEMIGRELGPDDVEATTWFMVERGRELSAVDLVKATGAVHAYRRSIAQWWADGWDMLLTPTCAAVAPPIGKLADKPDNPISALVESMPYAALTATWNTTGQPGISLPTHMSTGGLPIGVQLVGGYGREDQLFNVAAALETDYQWAENRAPLHA